MELVTGKLFCFFRKPIQKFSAISLPPSHTQRNEIIHIKGTTPSQKFSNTITSRRNNLTIVDNICEYITVMFHLPLNLRYKTVF